MKIIKKNKKKSQNIKSKQINLEKIIEDEFCITDKESEDANTENDISDTYITDETDADKEILEQEVLDYGVNNDDSKYDINEINNKKIYIKDNINVLEREDKIQILTIIKHTDIPEDKFKEVGTGTLIPFKYLDNELIIKIYNFIHSKLELSILF